jgi:nitrate reductase gamma subunit
MEVCMTELQVLMYLALIVFIVGTVYKAIKITRMPVHLRWDLYPIPHERGKHHYGGSYFEEVNWWTKPVEVSITSEIKEMSKEILFIQSMYRNNRSLWLFSFPFHFGLYVLIGYVLLVIFGAVLQTAGVSVTAQATNVIVTLVYHLTPILAVAGSLLGAFGALGLLFSRVFRHDLRVTSVRADYFNLFLILSIFVTLLVGWATVDRSFAITRGFVQSLISVTPAAPVPAAVTVRTILVSVFLIWLPFTHMTHFVGKYFTYHKVRWEDHPNIKGSELERAVTEALGYKINWSAPHIKKGATWAEAATSDTASKETNSK